jgi:hypothetical protein
MMEVLMLGNVLLLQLTVYHVGKPVLLEHSSEGNFFVAVGRLLSFIAGRNNVVDADVSGGTFVCVFPTGIASPRCPLPFLEILVTNYTRGRAVLTIVGEAYRQKVPIIWRVDNVVLSHSDGCSIG